MTTKCRRLFALLLGILMALSLVVLAACNNGEEEETPDPVYTIGLSAQVLELERYGRGELSATVYKDGVATADAVEWSSGNTSVATVSGGVVVAVGKGSTQITASAQGQEASCSVTVTDEGIVPRLTVADETIPLTYRAADPGYYDIVAEVEFYDYDTSDAVISYEAVTSADSDPSVIELSSEGRVTAKKAGRATVLVSATWNGYNCTEVPVSVVVYDDIEVQLLGEEDTVLVPGEETALYTWGGAVQENVFAKAAEFSAKVFKEAEQVTEAAVTWHTDNENVVSVDNGTVTAKSEGTAKIWCEYNDGVKVYESLRRTVTVSYPWVDLTEDSDAEYLFTGSSAADVLQKYVREDATHQTDAVYAEESDTSILSDGKIDISSLAGGAHVLSFMDTDTYGYILPVTVVTKIIGTAKEFMDWREETSKNAKTYTMGNTAMEDAYTYGEGEYILLTADITLTDDLQHQIWLQTSADTVPTDNKLGFLGTFDGNGYTITAQQAGRSGLFGDIGSGAVIKNLGVVATLSSTTVAPDASGSNQSTRPAALASRAYGVTLENCYFDVTCGSHVNHSGLLFMAAADITIENCVIVGTPGNGSAAGSSALVTSWVPYNHDNSIECVNVIAISRNAGNQAFAYNGYSAFTANVSVIDGSAAGFNIETYRLSGFDDSGFNTEYFFVEEGYIPQWNKTSENYKPEAAITADSVDVTTDAEAGNHTVQLDYTLTYRGTEVTPEKIEWSVTSGDTFASVSDAGVVTGLAEGTAEVTLTVTYDNVEYTDTITVNVTIPTDSVTPAQDVLFDKTNTSYNADALAKALWGDQTDKVITDLRYGSAAASASIVNDSAYVWTDVPAGEDRVFYAVSDNVAYEFTALVVSRQIGSAEEFMDWREETSKNAKTYVNDASAKADVYTYGEGEYILLTADITLTEDLQHQIWLQTAASAVLADDKVGFLGTFDGNGYTITAQKAGRSGLFGDIGSGAVIKNLGVVATLSSTAAAPDANNNNQGTRPAALASRAYGVTLENCYISFDASPASGLGYTGIFSTAGNITLENCVIEGTPLTKGTGQSALLTSYVPGGYTVTCTNVVAVSYNANNLIFAANDTNGNEVADITVINGSAAGFDITTYKLAESFDTSGFNTEYFFVETGYIPQWNKTAADFKPVLALSENSIEVTTETGADGNTAQLGYTFTYRGTVLTPEKVEWSVTSGDTFASVSDAGVVTGIAEGTAEITLTVTYDEQEYTATATVDVTMPVQDAELTEDVVFLKSVTDLASSLTAEDIWGAATDKTIADIRYGSAAASASILSEGVLDWTNVSLGENEFYVIGSDNVAYKFTALLVTKTIGSAEEFMDWRKANVWSGQSENGVRVKYTYGKDEYILLTSSFTIEEELMQRVYFEAAFDGVYTDIGFLGIFDGNGYTITAEKAALSGLFGDIGEGAVIKNLGVVARLSDTSSASDIGVTAVRPAALANRAYGVTLQNCYFDVTCGTNVNHSGLLFATAANITFENCVIVGTPGNGTAAATSALVTSWVPNNYYNSIYCENVVAISRNASNQAFAHNGNNSAFTADVTVIDGSAAGFDIATYELTDFDASGFNTEYFTVTENRIPQWKGVQA